MENGTLEKMIDSYIKLRDKKATIKKQQEEVLKEYTDAMIGIENFLQGYLKTQNVNSVSCDEGTVFLKRVRSATLADKGAFTEFVISTGEFDLCEMRAKVDAVEDWANANSGMLPPGVNFRVTESVGIQRK